MTSTKSIFHFDEVGTFEGHLGNQVGARILYRLLHVGFNLKAHGNHYFVLTGRSALLHSIGIHRNLLNTSLPKYQSPSFCELIQLSCLKEEDSVRGTFIDQGFSDYINQDDNLQQVHLLTGGVPRAIFVWINHLRTLKESLPLAKNDVVGKDMLVRRCKSYKS